MTAWLMRLHYAPSVIDGLTAFQITGSSISALIALGVPILRRAVLPLKDQ